jgi:hypothetical protein
MQPGLFWNIKQAGIFWNCLRLDDRGKLQELRVAFALLMQYARTLS